MSKTDWNFFREHLLAWYRPDRRPMPWKNESDPYKIWLSEIILQQTRVAQGLPYFERFVAAYPTVTDLASAPDDEVMKLWEGLGYYSRARNLLKAARMVAGDLGGKFPDTYAGLRTLAGVGPYTASAIASFAFNRQVAVLDGNVFRILSRYAGDSTPIDTGTGKKHYQSLVDAALGQAPAARFNQAIMDFGALVCTPKSPACSTCPLAANCEALATGTIYDLPVKAKTTKRRSRWFHYLVISDPADQRYLIEQRGEGDIWQSLYQFPLLEAETIELATDQLIHHESWPEEIPPDRLRFQRRSTPYTHQLTHQTIGVVFHVFHWENMPESTVNYQAVLRSDFTKYAFPRVITRFLGDTTLTLAL